jgi:bacillithiol system protein YtxJ
MTPPRAILQSDEAPCGAESGLEGRHVDIPEEGRLEPRSAFLEDMKELASLADLDMILSPDAGPVAIYKHSTQCGLSDSAIEEVQAFEAKHPAAGTLYYLDLLAHRDISNAIAQRLGIRHESPQVIVLKEGKPVAVLNHRAIHLAALVQAIR